MAKFRFVCGIAAALAAATLFAGIMGKWFNNKSLPPAHAQPLATSTPGEPASPFPADDRGFVNSAARCDGTQTALAVGRTQRSLVVICADQNGNYQYRGVRISDGALLQEPAETTSDGGFVARNDDMTYTVSAKQLMVTSGETVINQEPMSEYRQPHPFSAEAGAPRPNPTTTSGAPGPAR
ncbi:MAG: hypothetical protein JO044_11895 [Mycobacteriaceae bacterium]|nr:hypothetical protein [Mycobacteriaceae bacterium]MBV9638667.1 hypothetical protein [Mycobacteriaceae bacterium]